jgi:hypothetical protein
LRDEASRKFWLIGHHEEFEPCIIEALERRRNSIYKFEFLDDSG